MSTLEFIDNKTAEEYLCAICLNVMKQPVQIGCNGGHLFCRTCIIKLLQSQSTMSNLKCPTCATSFHPNSLVGIPFIQRKINDLKVKCPHHPPIDIKSKNNKKLNKTENTNNSGNKTKNKSKSPPLRRSKRIQEKQQKLAGKKRKRPDDEHQDEKHEEDDDEDETVHDMLFKKKQKLNTTDFCHWIGRFGDLNNHINQCLFQLIKCKHIGCTQMTQRQNIKTHINECRYCPILCPQCKVTKIPRCKLSDHLSKECIMTMIKCDKCEYDMLRKDKSNHIRYECGETLIECEYRHYGDNGCCMIKRKNKEKHNKEKMEYHLKLITQSHNKLDERHYDLQQEVNELRSRLDRLEGNQLQNINQNGAPSFFHCPRNKRPSKQWHRRR